MKYCFIVSSAIHTKNKVMAANVDTDLNLYDDEVRYNQTIETLKNIREYVDCDIYLLDSSYKKLSSNYRSELEKYCNVVEYSSPIANKVYESIKTIWKLQNSVETLAMSWFLKEHAQELKEYSRIFKISGRYLMTKEFSLYKHTCSHVKDKFLFLTENKDGLSTRLYSFDGSLVDYHIDVTKKILEFMQEVGHKSGNYACLEAGYRKFVEPQYLITTKVIGVCGYNANSGYFCNE